MKGGDTNGNICVFLMPLCCEILFVARIQLKTSKRKLYVEYISSECMLLYDPYLVMCCRKENYLFFLKNDNLKMDVLHKHMITALLYRRLFYKTMKKFVIQSKSFCKSSLKMTSVWRFLTFSFYIYSTSNQGLVTVRSSFRILEIIQFRYLFVCIFPLVPTISLHVCIFLQRIVLQHMYSSQPWHVTSSV